MEEAAAVREAALDAVRDVVPDGLRDDIEDFVEDGSLVPGVLTLLAARAAGADGGGLVDRAAGVQLIYDGLRLTRRLAHEEPWIEADADDPDADVEILAADVLVARGFYLLARTEAADEAVAVVRAFGRDQTGRSDADDPDSVDRKLERDVLDLAIVAGVSAAGRDSTEADALARDLAAAWDERFPDPEDLFDEAARERIAAVTGGHERAMNRND